MSSSETEKIKRYDNIYSLFVNDIPEELKEDGIETLLNDFGTITALLVPSEGKFAYVSYAFYSEAKAAIEGLHEKPPLDLQVQFRRKKDEKNDFISRTAYVECKIVAVDKSKQLYRVHKLDDAQRYSEFHENLNKASPALEVVKTPLVGKIYAVPYGGRWYRGHIVSFDPLIIDYIDQGIITELKNPNFKSLQPEFANVAKFSRFIKLSETLADDKIKNLSTGCLLKLRMTGYDCENDVIYVVREEEIKEDVESALKKKKKNTVEKKVQVDQQEKEIAEEKSQTVESESEVAKNSEIEEKKSDIVEENLNIVEKKIENEEKKSDTVKENSKIVEKKIENEEKKSGNDEKKSDDIEKELEKEESSVDVFENCPSILNNLISAMTNIPMKIVYKLNSTTATAVMDVTDSASLSLNEFLKNQCDDLAPDYQDYKPKLYDYICFKTTEDSYWYRGVVLSTEKPFKIASLDEGTEVMADKIVPIPTQFKPLGQFAAVQLKTSDEFPLKLGDTSELQVQNSEQREKFGLIVYAKFIDLDTKVEITQWKPWIKNNLHSPVVIDSSKIKINNPYFKNNSKVYIQSYLGPSIVCLKSLEPEEIENRNRLNQEILESLESLDYLINQPAIGDYVLAKYSNGKFYRAKILKNDINKIVVEFIDYGMIEATKMEKLKNITELLMEHPLGVVQVSLKGVTNDPPTKDALDYMRILIVMEEALTCNFEDTLQDGVKLKRQNNKVVNDKINNLLTPSWRKKKPESVIIDVQESNGIKSEQINEEKNKPDEEKNKSDEEKNKSDEEKNKLDEEKNKPDEEKNKSDEEKNKSDEEKNKPDECPNEPKPPEPPATSQPPEEPTEALIELPGATKAPKESSRKRKLSGDSPKKTKSSSRSKKSTDSPPQSKRSKESSPPSKRSRRDSSKSKRSRDDSPKSKSSTESRSVFKRLSATKDKPDQDKSTPIPWCTYCKRSTHNTSECYSKPGNKKNRKCVSPIRYKSAKEESTSTRQQASSSSRFCGYCYNIGKIQRFYMSHTRSECRFQKEDIQKREAQMNSRTRERYGPSDSFLRTYANDCNYYPQMKQEFSQMIQDFSQEVNFYASARCPNPSCPSYYPSYRRNEHGPVRCDHPSCPFQ